MKSTLLFFSGKVASSSSGLSDDRATMTRCVDEESSSTTELRRRWLRRRRGSEEECLRPWKKWLKMLTAERRRGEGCMAAGPQLRPAPLPAALWAQGKLPSAEVAGAERSGASPSALGSWSPGWAVAMETGDAGAAASQPRAAPFHRDCVCSGQTVPPLRENSCMSSR